MDSNRFALHSLVRKNGKIIDETSEIKASSVHLTHFTKIMEICQTKPTVNMKN